MISISQSSEWYALFLVTEWYALFFGTENFCCNVNVVSICASTPIALTPGDMLLQ